MKTTLTQLAHPSTPTRLWAAVALLACGAALTLVVYAADDKTAKPGASQPATAAKAALTVTAALPQRSNVATALSANGSIAPWQEAIVGAESNGMRLAEVRVNVGDVVRRGQVLATFVPDMAQADVAQSKAAVAEAEANLENPKERKIGKRS